MLCIFLLAACAVTVSANPDKIRDSCVRIYAEIGEDKASIGSGFAVGKPGKPVRYFVTNRHVVENAQTVYIIFNNTDDKVACQIKAISSNADLAILTITTETDKRKPAILRPFDVNKLSGTTEPIYAYGFPGDADTIHIGTGDLLQSTKKDLTVVDGTISRIYEKEVDINGIINEETISHTARISPGHSGGPTVDENGNVLGVNTWTLLDERGNEKFYGSVSVNEVIKFLEDEKVEFATTKGGGGFSGAGLIIALVVLAVVIIAAILLVLLRKKKAPSASSSSSGNRRVLYGESGSLAGGNFVLKAKTTIGRESKSGSPDIAFPSGTKGVSSLHCTVLYSNGKVSVIDENSSYGTWIDETRLTPGQPMHMHRGQKLYIGSKKEAFRLKS